MRKALRKVFEKRQYKGIAVLMFTLSYALFAIIPSIPTIKVLFSLEGFSFTRKLKFLFTSVASFTTVHPLYSVLLSVLLALLFSLTFTVSIFLYRKNYASKRSALSGILGGIGSAFGAGCFACGNLALGFLFTGVGSASLFGRLPFRGLEVDMLALLLLSFSLWYNLRLIEKNGVCEVK